MTSANAGGAHLTGIADGTRPSIFEIISQEGFSNALKPAASHIIKVLAENNPDGRFAVAYRYFDELYLTFDAIVQWHYILTRGATLSEAFYGLERKLATVGTPTQNLFRIRLSYAVSVVLPYVSAKLDKLIYSTDTINNEEQIPESIPRTATQKTIQQIYTYLKTTIKTINVVYLLAYVFGRSDYHNLTFRLLNMTMGYTSEERSKFMEEKQAELWMLSQWKNPKLLPKLLFRTLGESILFAVEVGTFFIQFLEWWNNDPKRSKIATGFSTVPLPPSDSKKVQNMVKLLPSDMNKCPICRKSIRNPTVISVSGVVYCYGCIFPQLRQNNVCPLTNIPSNINHLIRVYQ